jgi:hypothetical protein
MAASLGRFARRANPTKADCVFDDPAGLRPCDQFKRAVNGHEGCLCGVIARDWLAADPLGQEIDQNVMTPRIGEETVDDVEKADQATLDPRLLAEFAKGRVTDRFAGLDPSAGQTPFPQARRSAPTDQQNLVPPETDDAHGRNRKGRRFGHDGHTSPFGLARTARL